MAQQHSCAVAGRQRELLRIGRRRRDAWEAFRLLEERSKQRTTWFREKHTPRPPIASAASCKMAASSWADSRAEQQDGLRGQLEALVATSSNNLGFCYLKLFRHADCVRAINELLRTTARAYPRSSRTARR